ncbi:phosphoribosyltransferase [Micromonospora sp. NBC_01813]|uniref:phosphoribosyltransferase n=1 Tax=Micromonospora sp. NBC_01813 TaxID=2975988 RepID=UPI002DD96747|nr:phosphoribosyltransferase [Micromonospora sp. NBC_01813]WSA07032.1 phosphoribosyltransferase [Micromonospora sp. NBC_01813]
MSTARPHRLAPTRQPVHRLTLTSYDHATTLLADAVTRRLGPITAVIGIGTSGVPLAHSLATRLTAKPLRINARHERAAPADSRTSGHVTVDLRPLDTALNGRRLVGTVLLADDTCRTGATLTTVYPKLAPYLTAGSTLHTVVLFRHTTADYNPHLWLWDITHPVHLPWQAPLPADAPVHDLTLPDTPHTC